MPTQNNKPDETNGTSRNKSNLSKVKESWFYRFFFKGRSAVWTAIFTGVLSVYTVKLFQVANRTDDTSRNANRAFINFNGIDIGVRMVEKLDDPQAKWTGQEIQINWNNSGNTPAKDLIIQQNTLAFRPDLPKNYDFPLNPQQYPGAIGAKGVYGAPLLVPFNSLSDGWHDKGKIYLWGTAVYKDAFPDDPTRLTEFCVGVDKLTVNQATPQSAPQNTPTQTTRRTLRAQVPATPTAAPATDIDRPGAQLMSFSWNECSQHNCYDEDCSDYKERTGEK